MDLFHQSFVGLLDSERLFQCYVAKRVDTEFDTLSFDSSESLVDSRLDSVVNYSFDRDEDLQFGGHGCGFVGCMVWTQIFHVENSETGEQGT